MAKEERGRSDSAYILKNELTLFMDEKWDSEKKADNLVMEARKDSPVAAKLRFKQKDAETQTQRIKIMHLYVVTSNKPIGFFELNFKKWNMDNKQLTKGGKPAKGVTADYLRHIILKKVLPKARKVLGNGALRILHDKADTFTALMRDGAV